MHHEADKDWLDDDFKLGDPIVLSADHFDAIMKIIENPPKPNKFLIDLMTKK